MTTQTGTVKWFNESKGFGFIAQDAGGADLFAHFRDIQGNGFKTLLENQRVEFEVKQGQKGLQAANIRVLPDRSSLRARKPGEESRGSPRLFFACACPSRDRLGALSRLRSRRTTGDTPMTALASIDQPPDPPRAPARSACRRAPTGASPPSRCAEPGAGGVLVKTLLLSLDPAMRGWMNEGKSYIAPVGIGEVMRAGGIGVVVASKNPAFAVGDHVSGALGVQEYCSFDAGRHQAQRPRQDRPARSARRRSGSTCSACPA